MEFDREPDRDPIGTPIGNPTGDHRESDGGSNSESYIGIS